MLILKNGLMDLPPPSLEKSILPTFRIQIGIQKMHIGLFLMDQSMLFGFKTWIQSWTIIWRYVWPTLRELSWGLSWECSLKFKIFQLLHQPLSVDVVWSIFHLIIYLGCYMLKVGWIKQIFNLITSKSWKDSSTNLCKKPSRRNVNCTSLSQIH